MGEWPVGRVLVIGASGMLGCAWKQLLAHHSEGEEHAFPTHEELDLADQDSVDQWITSEYPVVVNCAAYTDVDGAQTNQEQANKINGAAVGYLAKRCVQAGSTLVHYSTDYVFNGQSDQPYRVDQLRDPVNAYGASKAIGEQAIESSGCRHLIIRTSWLYGAWGNNFVRTIAKLASEREMLQVVHDQRGRPSEIEALASNSMALLTKGGQGVYHVTDGGQCTWYEFASEIVRLAKVDCWIEPCTTEAFPRPAPRPAYSVLDLTKTQELIGPMNSWQGNLSKVMAALEVNGL